MIELLAPAKDKICAKAAIDYGADAVYVGANDFGARKNAANSLEDIAEIVEYAHKFNVKIWRKSNFFIHLLKRFTYGIYHWRKDPGSGLWEVESIPCGW